MDDTAQEFRDFYHYIIMQRSGEERLMMGDRMFVSARTLVEASLPENIDDTEKRYRLFIRFYESDFTPLQREKIKAVI